MSFDIKKNDPAMVSEVGYEFNVILPDGTETDFKIKVRGENSPKVDAFRRKEYAEMDIRERAAKRANKKEADPQTITELLEKIDRAAANRVISWSGLKEDGVEIPYSEETAERLMRDYKWLGKIVMKESEDLLNFRHKLSK